MTLQFYALYERMSSIWPNLHPGKNLIGERRQTSRWREAPYAPKKATRGPAVLGFARLAIFGSGRPCGNSSAASRRGGRGKWAGAGRGTLAHGQVTPHPPGESWLFSRHKAVSSSPRPRHPHRAVCPRTRRGSVQHVDTPEGRRAPRRATGQRVMGRLAAVASPLGRERGRAVFR